MPARPIAVFLHDTVGLISGVLKGSVRRIMAATSLQNADGTKDVTVTTDGSQERLDVSAALDTPIPAGTNNIGDVDVVSSALPSGAATEASLATRVAESTWTGRIGEVQASPTQYTVLERLKTIYDTLIAIKDTAGIKKITDALPTGTNVLGSVKLRGNSGGLDLDVTTDAVDGRNKAWIQGTVSISAPEAPAGATDVQIVGDTPLSISGTEDSTNYVIPNGETFTLQQIIAGAEGDSTERGTAIEVYYNNGTDRLVTREYITGFTSSITINKSVTRDGTSMDGNGTYYVFLRRRRLSGGLLEVDAVAYGFVE